MLADLIWPGQRAWTSDIDRRNWDPFQHPIFLKSSLRSLRYVAEIVASGSTNRPIWPWILTAGCRNRLRNKSLQFCPLCLASDKQPYYRYQWRLAWHTVCEEHQCRLLDSCSDCRNPIEPHRLQLHHRRQSICATCSSDLETQIAPDGDIRARGFQMLADKVVTNHAGSYGQCSLTSVQWFALCRYFMALIRLAALPGHDPLGRAFRMVGIDITRAHSPKTGLSLELLPTDERMRLLSLLGQLVTTPTSELIEALRKAGLTRATLSSTTYTLPSCIEEQLPDLGIGARRSQVKRIQTHRPNTKETVERMVARLQRKIRRP